MRGRRVCSRQRAHPCGKARASRIGTINSVTSMGAEPCTHRDSLEHGMEQRADRNIIMGSMFCWVHCTADSPSIGCLDVGMDARTYDDARPQPPLAQSQTDEQTGHTKTAPTVALHLVLEHRERERIHRSTQHRRAEPGAGWSAMATHPTAQLCSARLYEAVTLCVCVRHYRRACGVCWGTISVV